ncbi:efflux RND transporter periplasmic adaptor subunit [Alteromonas sp. LMIT006]|uniref:efflux RND transporter periplasmic adaptor subunit n=1 Tax=Alteromonadaceae TaxID=72275 RepID=UPI0020CA5D81|nr:efflux RND transporter periplasmic adaptor subunit [Alteromonas sp. LMIT006]UTP72488.1 efflux RND transporter periplasmic adaptor subunit [Alteromonas sp. LMIT006]
MKKLNMCLLFCLGLTGCGDTMDTQIPTYTVTEQEFVIAIDAFGEVEPASAERITTPGRRPMVLSWLVDENTLVKAGDVIARFDSERIMRQKLEEEFAIRKIQQDILAGIAEQTQEKSEIAVEQSFVDAEFQFVEQFAIDDLRLYSKLEIIDTMANRDFLEAKDGFLDWKASSVDEQHASEQSVLDIRKSGHAKKLKQHQMALNQLEVRAPSDGLILYMKDRRGEKPAVGNTVFPGSPIAQIPDLSNLQVSLYVLANEAIELDKGNQIEFRLDAFPEKTFTGQILEVAKFPSEIQRGDPTKYFALSANIDQQDALELQPGRKLTAKITVETGRTTLTVPLQSVIYENEQSYVYVQDGNDFSRQVVTTGRKNLHFIEILEGIEPGTKIALSGIVASQNNQEVK